MNGISLYLQGTLIFFINKIIIYRYIPVPTGNSKSDHETVISLPVYPCTYRELFKFNHREPLQNGISLYLQGTHVQACYELLYPRYIPVPTGNSKSFGFSSLHPTVYPCTYRELEIFGFDIISHRGISLYLQGTLEVN